MTLQIVSSTKIASQLHVKFTFYNIVHRTLCHYVLFITVNWSLTKKGASDREWGFMIIFHFIVIPCYSNMEWSISCLFPFPFPYFPIFSHQNGIISIIYHYHSWIIPIFSHNNGIIPAPSNPSSTPAPSIDGLRGMDLLLRPDLPAYSGVLLDLVVRRPPLKAFSINGPMGNAPID